MVQNKRRTEIATGNPGISSNFIDMEFLEGQTVNVHGLRVECIVEPEDADANANGVVAVYCLPSSVVQNTDLPATLGAFGDEKFAPYLWGMSVWAGSNQNPWHWEFVPKSTRNIQNGGRIVVNLRINGLTIGNARQTTMITCFTTPI